MIEDLLTNLKVLKNLLSKNAAVNVNGNQVKGIVIDKASEYFRTARQEVASLVLDEEELSKYDEDWQNLIRLAQRNNSKASYLSIINRLTEKTRELAVLSRSTAITAQPAANGTIALSQDEQRLIATLGEVLPSSAQSYRQGLKDLAGSPERLSYRGTATEFRESLREVLDHLAPDEAVKSQAGFKVEPGTNGPTMKQKVRFILSSRGRSKSNRELTEKSVELIESLSADVTRAVYNRASLSTHLQTTEREVRQIQRYLSAVFYDILEIKRQ